MISHKNKHRISAFKANKTALYSLYLFAIVAFICSFAEFIANDKPLLVMYDGDVFFPSVSVYAETQFGGDFETEADYADPYIIELINEKGFLLWPLIPYSFDTHIDDLDQPAPSPPSSKNWFGTDDQARDVLARTIYGLRVSIVFALLVTIGSSLLGVFVGAIQGYFGGMTDLFGQRFLEIWSSLPVLFLLIILSSVVKPNFWWLLSIILLFSWTSLVDVVRAETLKVRQLDYVQAARTMGVNHRTIIIRHVLPNACVAALTFLPFIMTGAIGTLTSLDFLGFGLPPGSASLGELLAQAKANIHAYWLGLTGFFSVSLLLTLLVFIGAGIRDALDPNHTERYLSSC